VLQNYIEPLPEPVPQRAPSGSPCGACSVRDLAVCQALTKEELVELSATVSTVRLGARQAVVQEGEEAGHVFIVQSGALRIFKLLPDGRRQVIAFLFEGDFLGIVDQPTYAYSAEAIDEVRLCRFLRPDFDDLLARFRGMRTRLLKVANHELKAAQEQALLLGRKNAKEKVASFLIAFAEHEATAGRPDNPISIPVPRYDIGDYLGLTQETVSRIFKALSREGVITLLSQGRVRLDDRERLSGIARPS
jgi:CRP/FNR family transcriptional regulator